MESCLESLRNLQGGLWIRILEPSSKGPLFGCLGEKGFLLQVHNQRTVQTPTTAPSRSVLAPHFDTKAILLATLEVCVVALAQKIDPMVP